MDVLLEYLEAKRASIDAALQLYLPSPSLEPRIIHECMGYSVEGGKRLRPTITLAVAEMLGCSQEKVLPTCAAIEFIHTHSLILDDLPCMDNDDLRRGRPTSHRLFGEGIALLAADALLNLAIALLGANHRLAGIRPETALDIIREVGESVGTNGVIGGQAADLTFSSPSSDGLAGLEQIHMAKTARLFRLSARAGALVAGAAPAHMEAVTGYAEQLGLAFQIVDDILDQVESRTTGESGGRVEPSYLMASSPEGARALAAMATGKALEALSPLGNEANLLRSLARYNLTRES